MLTHVDFRSGEMLDLAGITKRGPRRRRTHAVGLRALGRGGALRRRRRRRRLRRGLWLQVPERGAGCSCLPLRSRLVAGHLGESAARLARPRATLRLRTRVRARGGQQAFFTSSPSIVALAALDGALDVWDRRDHGTGSRRRASSSTDLFIAFVEERLAGSLRGRHAARARRRGSQVALRHDHAYGVDPSAHQPKRRHRATSEHPDVARFGFTPLYFRFVDVYDAVETWSRGPRRGLPRRAIRRP